MAAAKHTEVTVTTAAGGYAQTIHAGRHTLAADEPTTVGGTDVGPDPYQLLLASLGTCTSMTMQMYAKRKGWPLEAVTVHLRHRKIHAEDCAKCDKDASAYLDRIEKEITLKGDGLTEGQQTRLLEIADRCPVHKTLHNQLEVRTTML